MVLEEEAKQVFPYVNELGNQLNKVKNELERASILGASLEFLLEIVNVNDFFKETILEKLYKEYKRTKV